MPYPDDSNLTSLEHLKRMLDPAPSAGADPALTEVIERASAVIVGIIGAPALYYSGSDITERRNGNGGTVMIPKVTPIVSVTSLTINGSAVSLSDGTTAGYTFDERFIYLVGDTFPRGFQNVTLVYRGGITDGSADGAELEHACIAACALWWKRRAHIDQSSVVAGSGMGSITFTQADLPKESWLILNRFRRITPPA